MSTASDLDRVISLASNAGATVDALGASVESWSTYASAVRARVVQQSGREFLAEPGLKSQRRVIFRIRWRDGVEVTHRVTYGGVLHDIVEVREIERHRWLDLHCTAAG